MTGLSLGLPCRTTEEAALLGPGFRAFGGTDDPRDVAATEFGVTDT